MRCGATIPNCAKSLRGSQSWENREGAGGETQAVARLGPAYDDQRSGWRNAVELGHYLDLPMAVGQQPGLGRQVSSRIGVHGFVAVGDDPALFVEEADCGE